MRLHADNVTRTRFCNISYSPFTKRYAVVFQTANDDFNVEICYFQSTDNSHCISKLIAMEPV